MICCQSSQSEKPSNITSVYMKKPTISEIAEFCKIRGNRIDAEQFWDYYESKGWVIGKSPMKSWQACVRTWERNTTHKMAMQGREKSYTAQKKVYSKPLPRPKVNPEIRELRKEWFPLCNTRGMTASQRIATGKKRRDIEKKIKEITDKDSSLGAVVKYTLVPTLARRKMT